MIHFIMNTNTMVIRNIISQYLIQISKSDQYLAASLVGLVRYFCSLRHMVCYLITYSTPSEFLYFATITHDVVYSIRLSTDFATITLFQTQQVTENRKYGEVESQNRILVYITYYLHFIFAAIMKLGLQQNSYSCT